MWLLSLSSPETFGTATSAGTIEALRDTGMRAPFGSSVPATARVISIAVLEPPVIAIGNADSQEFTVSEGRVRVSATGQDFREEVLSEDIVGTYRFSVTAGVHADNVSITVR